MMRKKGVMTFLVEIIIMLAVVISVLFLMSRAISKADKTTLNSVCKSSVALREKAVFNIEVWPFPTTELKLSPIHCKTYETDLKEEYKENEVKKEEVMKYVGTSMETCWWQFAEGKLPHTVSLSASTIEKQGDYCFRCEVITMPKIVNEKGEEVTISMNEFVDYLRKNDIGPRSKESYYDYITKHENIPGRLGLFTDEIRSYHTYEIFFSDWAGDAPNGIYLNDLQNGPPKSWIFAGKNWGLLGAQGVGVASVIGGTACVLGGVGSGGIVTAACAASASLGATAFGFAEYTTPDCRENCECHIIIDSGGK
ncbi:MAG: hypothetical protein QW331_02545 [Candidatus Woesearchaeota archaeon]